MEWLVDFFETVDAVTREGLINLGLPVAGMKIEVERDGYRFGEDFFVGRDLRYRYRGVEVRPRVWKNLAVLEGAERNIGEVVKPLFGVERPNYTFYDTFSFSLGRVTVEDVYSVGVGDLAEPFPGVRFKGGEWVFPDGAPENMGVVIGYDVELVFRVGEFMYGLVRSRDYGDYQVGVVFRDIGYIDSMCAPDEFPEMVGAMDYAGVWRALKDVLEKRVRRTPRGFEVGNVKVVSGPSFVAIGRDVSWEELERSVRGVKGWMYVSWDFRFFRKKIGDFMMVYYPDSEELSFIAVNGWRSSVKVPLDLITLDVEEILRVADIL